jgi:hypothetical protein
MCRCADALERTGIAYLRVRMSVGRSRPTPGSYYAKLAAVLPASADFINSNYIFVNVGAAPVISITPLQIRFLQSVNISYGDQPTFDLSHVPYVVPGDRITLTAILTAGDVSVTGEASLNAGATVSVGITGIKLQAGASAAASVTLQDGIVYTTIGVQAGASGEAALKLISLSPSIYGAAQAGIQAQIATGVSGSLGQGVSGSAQIEAAAFVVASAKDGFKVKDGNIQVIADNFTGNGASIGVSGNLDTGPVGVNAGVTAYSPGVLGEKFDPTIGLDGDKVNIGADLGLAIGPFGVGIKFNVTLNAGDVASYFANVGSGLAEAFGGLFSSSCDGTCTRARNDATAVEKLTALNPITDAQTILTTLQNGDFYIPTLVTPDGTRWGQERNRPPIVQQYEAVAQNWVKAQSDFAAASKQQTELVTQMVKVKRPGFSGGSYL